LFIINLSDCKIKIPLLKSTFVLISVIKVLSSEFILLILKIVEKLYFLGYDLYGCIWIKTVKFAIGYFW